jgi:acyl carrier protein
MVVAAVQAMVVVKVHEAAGASVSVHDTLMESGVDSLAAVELVGLVQRELGDALKLPSTLVFDYPTVGAIAEFAAGHLTVADAHEDTVYELPLAVPPSKTAAGDKITSSSSSMCATTPGERADTVWRTLSRTHNSVQQIPARRFDTHAAVQAAPEL